MSDSRVTNRIFRILRSFCPPQFLEEIEGDLLQKYERDLNPSDRLQRSDGYWRRRAKRRLLWNVIQFCRPAILIRNHFLIHTNFMLGNYLKTTFRMLGRNKSYSFINIFGLAVGLAASILIFLWVQYECSYDHFAANYRQIYQVKVNFTYNGTVNTAEDNCIPVYLTLPETDSRIKNTCFTSSTYGHAINYKEKKTGKEVLAVSKEFLEMFGLPLVKGSIHSLDDPRSIMLNESTAKELFGDQDPINQFIQYDNKDELKVSGIFKDVPYNSTFWFHALVSTAHDDEWVARDKEKWNSFYPRIYVILQAGASVDDVNLKVKDLVKNHFNDGSNPELFLHAMDRWFLYDKFVDGREAGGKIEYVRLFTFIASLILIIACINYANLATARSQRRAKEVGIRKSIGSRNAQLIHQFLTESFLITTISFVIALLLVRLSIPSFNMLVHARLSADFTSVEFLILSAAAIIVSGLLSGCYPAFYFSSLQPIKVLKGKVQVGKNAWRFRSILVSSQYVVSFFLLIGVIVVYKQIQHVKDRELGYSQQNLICYAFNDQMAKNYSAIKSELLNTGVVEAVTKSNEGIDVDYFTDYVEWRGKQTTEKIQFSRVSTEYDFTKTNSIKILEGRDFSPLFKSDSSAVLVNKTAVSIMGMKDPIGEKIKTGDRELTIIGVVADVVRGSPFDPVAPCYIGMLGDANNHITIRLSKSNNLKESLDRVNAVFKKLDPMNVDEPMFVNERFADNFKSINFIGQLAGWFAGLGIALTCLGALGLASYEAEQRTREMAIRKVLGASVGKLLWLLSNYFVRIVIFSALVAAPISWWALNEYLQNYSYRIPVPWWTIPLATISLLVVTITMVTIQVGKIASTNPVTALKNE